MFNKSQLYKQINLLLQARHKIVRNNIDIAITQEDISMTAAIYEFILLLNIILQNIRINKKSAPE